MPNQQAHTSATISKTLISVLLSLLMICAFMPHEANAANTTTTNTPTGDAIESWTFDYKAYLDAEYANASEPVVSGDYVYIAVNNKIVMLNKEDGKVVKEADLATSIGYTTRAIVTNDLFVVPLNDGRLQANKLETLDVWTTEAVKSGAQNCSTLTVDGTNIYFGTVNVNSTAGTYTFTDGYLTCVSATNGEQVWQNLDENEGYYWDGGAVVDHYFIISGCAGTVKVFNKSTGAVQSTLSLGAKVNSDVVFSEDGSKGYVVTRDGKLHVLSLDAMTGALTNAQTNDLGLTGSACTPTISNGKLYVGGEVNNSESSALAIVNLTNYETQLVKTADGSALLGGGIKGAPLVSTNSNGTYVYFTVNNAVTTDNTYTAGGGVFSYKVGDTEAKSIYDATDHHQYCDSPVTADTDGNLYYINDSCTLFKLQPASVQMNRLYNKWTGEHFYTASTEEKENLVKVGWTDEGIGWTAPTKSNAPVYRLYNKYVEGGDHHYTLSKDERDACVKAGWTDEGIGWYSDEDQGVAVYRQYNPFATTGTHNYTTSKDENDKLVSVGWNAEGISWYGVKES